MSEMMSMLRRAADDAGWTYSFDEEAIRTKIDKISIALEIYPEALTLTGTSTWPGIIPREIKGRLPEIIEAVHEDHPFLRLYWVEVEEGTRLMTQAGLDMETPPDSLDTFLTRFWSDTCAAYEMIERTLGLDRDGTLVARHAFEKMSTDQREELLADLAAAGSHAQVLDLAPRTEPTPTVLLALASAHLGLGQMEEARAALDQVPAADRGEQWTELAEQLGN